MYEHARDFILVDHTAEKPCEMDANVHDVREACPGAGDDGGMEMIATKMMRDIRNMSALRQLLLGSSIGFISGYVLTRTGKYVCVFFGATVIVLQLAGQNDYIKFNLLRALSSDDVHRQANEPRRRRVRSMMMTFFHKLHAFLMEQPNLTGGIIGGFLIGLGFS